MRWLLVGLLRSRPWCQRRAGAAWATQVLAASALLAVFLMWVSSAIPGWRLRDN